MGLREVEPQLKSNLPARRGGPVGLQVKSVLVLTIVVFASAALGGWLYYIVARDILVGRDRTQAESFAGSLSASAGPGLATGDREALQKLAMGLLYRTGNVHSVSILDRDGNIVAVAERVRPEMNRLVVAHRPVSLSYEMQRGCDFLEVGRPVVASSTGGEGDVLAGAVRLVLDTQATANVLAGVRRQTTVIAATIVLCIIPLGNLLVLRVIVMPIRRLMKATRQLADGDFSARAEACRNDEIGELAGSFDIMAEKVRASQRRLRLANESLEQQVADRTAELKQANRKLREEAAEKEDFLRAVSHDLNAPLRNIAGMATMISMKFRDQLPEEAIARLQRIQSNVDAETELIGELLELSRIRTRPERRQMVDFGPLMRSLSDAFEYELKAKDITLKIGEDMPRLYVERNRMRQAFQNLIDNAIKYMGEGRPRRIDIGYSLSDGMHRFSVADTGPGIAAADRERIFQIFRRAASAATGGVAGKGVGLALVRSVAANYDGRVWVESQPPEGSVFYVSLSARQTVEPETASEAARDEAERAAVGEHTG